jgi:hypothetical protein
MKHVKRQTGLSIIPFIQVMLLSLFQNSRGYAMYRRSDGMEVASHQQETIQFSMERGMKFMN